MCVGTLNGWSRDEGWFQDPHCSPFAWWEYPPHLPNALTACPTSMWARSKVTGGM